MGAFDSYADTPFQIKVEGEKITLSFSPGLPADGQGTVLWNIPDPAAGCQTDDGRNGAYCGIVVLLSTTPLTANQSPKDEVYYTADPTADADIHSGDTINGALVVGAFYEGNKKSRGESLTTSFIVSDLKTDTPYYVAGYAVDCQGRYHRDGVRAYSDEFGKANDPGTPSTQVVSLGTGVLPTDGTGLTPGRDYQFDIQIDDTFPDQTNPVKATVTVNGTDAGTFEQLVTLINNQLKLAENPPQSPVAPNTGLYFWDAVDQQLFQFDGEVHNSVDFLFEPTDPANLQNGDYWFDPEDQILQQWNTPNPGWNVVPFFSYHKDPTTELNCDDYWYNGSQGYNWNGSTWCEIETLIGAMDPSIAPTLPCGTFWYDQTNEVLNEWDPQTSTWVSRSAIMWEDDPLTLSTGTYWFDLETDQLFVRDGSSWDNIFVIVQDDEPTSPTSGVFWFAPTTEVLSQWNSSLSVWETRDVLVWPGDPTNIESCNLWWRTTDDTLFVRDTVNGEWDEVVSFTQTTVDPSLAPSIDKGTVWYDTTENKLKVWDGSVWVDVTFIDYSTDPNIPTNGTVWLNTSNNTWQIWGVPTASQWNDIDPIDTNNDPSTIAQETLWFDSANNLLFQRIGSSWVSIPFTTMPLFPKEGDKWYNSSDNTLNEWNGTSWVEIDPLASVALLNGHLRFMSTAVGSNVCIMILVPGSGATASARTIGSGYANFSVADIQGHAFGHHGAFGGSLEPPLPSTNVDPNNFLFNNIPDALVVHQRYGTDGVSSIPSYQEINIGDDGTPDERRSLVDAIRQQLGSPVVEVELTNQQIDTAIRRSLDQFREKSSLAYKRAFYFLDIQPGIQSYYLTNRQIGYHKIVNVTSAHRFTSAFLSTAHGAGVYGQVVLQHLYNMGTYDLSSFHMISQYVEQLEHLFATRMTFHWDEVKRKLDFFQSFVHSERILLDTAVERTEQEIFVDRYTKPWVERFALAESMLMLAQVRGKYGSLPGAGGGISLNAAELVTQAETIKTELNQQLEDFINQAPEDYGLNSTLIIG